MSYDLKSAGTPGTTAPSQAGYGLADNSAKQERQPHISKAFTALESKVQDIGCLLKDLNERLQPVLRQQPPPANGAGEVRPNTGVKLADCLLEIGDTLELYRRNLSNILDQLEV
jgi:hypothetical protein